MFVSYHWLQEYVDIADKRPEEIAEKMTRGGIEIDFVHEMNKGVSKVVVGYVQDVSPHPDADKLGVCQVDIGGDEPVQIVCGAANVAKGQKVAVAKVGARLPGGMKIKKAKLRGQVSQGMICSLQELGIEGKLVPRAYAEGIYVFPESEAVNVGDDALALLNLNDQVLELDLTPNRSDCMHMLGVAYEIAALYDRLVALPNIRLDELKQEPPSDVQINIEDVSDTPYYSATLIKNVKVGPSPLWLQTRLIAAGIRPISNVVDITNYVLLEYGQPLHAFDYDQLDSKKILVRRAKQGELFTTLDGVERTLGKEQLVVTNGKDPVALAGVMGGANSEVSEQTTTILLEAAVFQSSVVRKSARHAGLRSDSSARFERGVNEALVAEAARRAAMLIQELCGGEVLAAVNGEDVRRTDHTVVTLDLEAMNTRLGTKLQLSDVASVMARLHFPYEKAESGVLVTIPHRRPDITIPEDLYEEVARLYGYDNIPSTLPEGATAQGRLTTYQSKRRKAKRYLQAAGLSEVMSYSLTSAKKADWFKAEAIKPIRVAMPMSEERSTMRTSLIPHLYDICAHNLNRKNRDVFVYELGSVFLSEQETLAELPKEHERLAGLVSGQWIEHLWQGEKKPVDFFVLKGILEGLFEVLGLSKEVAFQSAERAGFHPGRTAEVMLSRESIGFVAQVHPTVEKDYNLSETYVFELDFEALLSKQLPPLQFSGIPRYPSVARDIALVVGREIPAGTLKSIIWETGSSLLTEVALFDVYEGEHIEKGKKSAAFSLTYRDPERTLTDDEVANVHETVLTALTKKAGAELRS
ncbi:phenylalanine--tRNA ligase subunit beta [Shouchella shacheensis]|uniref:phenylalanine--tRNA ligase subunit beta n=1 Tax=Shouchella shacheensis TaxID=1649580 RepID=UPI0007400A3A|nr:phenylalanine--tRNA ligase subunit beta [Shouchella shacheensis]